MATEQTEDFFESVSIEDLQTTDPEKQTAALTKLIFLAGRGKDVTHYFDLVAKHGLAPASEKSVKQLAYSCLKYFRLSYLQWERVTAFILNDLRSNDLDIRVSALKKLEVLPSALIVNLLDTTKVTTQVSFNDPQRPDESASVRASAISVITTLLTYRKAVRDNNNFNVSAWSIITDRVLNDPSRKVFRAGLSAIHMLFSDMFAGGSYRDNGLGHPLQPQEKVLFAKYTRVALTKLVPHLNLLLKRMHWADNESKTLAPFVVSCCLTHIAENNFTNASPKLSFLTSPRQFLIETIELELMPLLYSKEDALVYEAAKSIVFAAQRSDAMKPTWIFAVCRSMLGLLSRDSSRSVATRVVTLLLDAVDLLPASLLLGVCIRVFQQIGALDLPSSYMRLYFIQRLMHTLVKRSIQEQLRQQGGSHIGVAGKLFDDLIKSSWFQQMLSHHDENHFSEEVLACMMRAVVQTFLEAASSLTESVDSGASKEQLMDAKETYREWRQILVSLTLACAKCCLWKTHLRTFLYESYVKLVDTAGFSLQSLSKRDREKLTELLNAIADFVPQLRHDALCLRLMFVLVKHIPPVPNMRKSVDVIFNLIQTRFLAWLPAVAEQPTAPPAGGPTSSGASTPAGSASPAFLNVFSSGSAPASKQADASSVVSPPASARSSAASPTGAPSGAAAAISNATAAATPTRQLGYRADQLKKTTLTATDIETLYLILSMLAVHPVIADTQQVDATQRRAVLVQQIKAIAAVRTKVDATLSQRMQSILSQVQNPNPLEIEILPISKQIFYPPVEFMEKNIIEKVPDDDFVIHFSRAKMKLEAHLTAMSQPGSDESIGTALGLVETPTASKKASESSTSVSSAHRVHTLTSASDPFLVTARFEVDSDFRIRVYLQVTNLTRFEVPKLTLLLNLSGRIDIASDSAAALEFENVAPASHIETMTTLRVHSFASNTILSHLILVPSADKPTSSLEINCVPQRLNMHELVRPWVMDSSEFLKQWSRISTTFQFKAFVSEGALVRTLADKIASFYNCILHWNHAGNAFYSEAFAGLTMWEEYVLFTINGTMTELGGVVLRFEIRSSSLNLSVLLDSHKEQWLNDLFGENIRLLEDASLTGDSAKTLFDVTRPSISRREYSEETLLQQWSDVRRNIPV